MHDRHILRTQSGRIREGVRKKGMAAPIDEWLRVDERWRAAKRELDEANAAMNAISRSIGQLLAQGRRDEADAAKADTKALKERIQALEEQERGLERELLALEMVIPNAPHESVPEGAGPEENLVLREWGRKPHFDFEAKPHWEVAESLKLLDAPRGGKVAGSGFMLYTGWGARLQRALFSFMVDHQTRSNGYYEIYPPYLVNSASLTGTGQLPKFGDDLYRADDDLYLIPTAEVPVTNLHRDEILEAWQLPIRYVAYSACFRKEAGAAGKDTRGLLRMHQFDKVELVKFCLPETSYDELESLIEDAESVLRALGLHYRVVLLCAGDMSFGNAKCYDLEVWAPGVGKYLEISSCSNFEAFQARRANIRCRRGPGEKPEFVHILNGSGLATPRLFAALIETYLQPDGSVTIPEPLRPYAGTDAISPAT
jgi:seryl-tRNA synthetase